MLCSLRPEGARRLMVRLPLPRQILTGTSRAWVQSGPYYSEWDHLPVTTCGRGDELGRVVRILSTIGPRLFVFSAVCPAPARSRPNPLVRPCVPHRRHALLVCAVGLPGTAAISCPPVWRLLFQFLLDVCSAYVGLPSGCPRRRAGPYAKLLGNVDFLRGLAIAKNTARSGV